MPFPQTDTQQVMNWEWEAGKRQEGKKDKGRKEGRKENTMKKKLPM